MNKREQGAYYENLACQYLEENGAKIEFRNFRCKSGEIDIIASDGKYLVFVEVKYRTGTRYGSPEGAVDYRKQNAISRVSDFYRKRFGISEDISQRFDVVAISADEDDAIRIKWLKNAFAYIPRRNIYF